MLSGLLDDLVESSDHFLACFSQVCCLLIEEVEIIGLESKFFVYLLDALLE